MYESSLPILLRTHTKIKCHRYWPESGAAIYNQLQVVLHSVNEYPDYVLREFKLIDTSVSAERGLGGQL